MSEATKGRVQQFCAQVWWMVLLRGLALLIFGGLLFMKPEFTALLLVQYLGVYFLLDGILVVINSMMGRRHMQGWGWGLVMGLLEILTAVFIFGHPLASTIIAAGAVVYCVAFLAILFGLVGVFAGIQVRKEVKGEWAMIAGGLLAIIFGVLLLLNPLATATIYLTVMGVFAFIGGIAQIVTAFAIRKIGARGIA